MNNRPRREESNYVESPKDFDGEIALTTSSSKLAKKHEWYIDSAASKHMTYNKSILMDFISYDKPAEIYLGDNTIIYARGEGAVRIATVSNEKVEPTYLKLQKVLYVPDLTKNLVSVPSMTLSQSINQSI